MTEKTQKMKNFAPDKIELQPMSLMSFALSLISLIIVTTSLISSRFDQDAAALLFVDTFICCLFLFQLTVDLFRAEDKRAYLKAHWIDYLASIPVIEPLRFARVFQIFRVLRLLRSSQSIMHNLADSPRETTLASLLILLTLLLSVGSTFILLAESQSPEANITNAEDALWWVFVTISTVGYGDHYPVTFWGKIIAVGVITAGVAIFGMVAGLITASVNKRNRHQEQSEMDTMLAMQRELLDRVSHLEQQLAASEGNATNNTAEQEYKPRSQQAPTSTSPQNKHSG